jgi:hypothetical protein
MTAVGAIHVALTPVLFRPAVRSALDAGVVGAVEADPDEAEGRGRAFWFATTGLGLMAYGLAVAERERQPAPLPAALPVALVAFGAWGVVLLPKSPFWVFGPLAALAAARRRRATIEG